MLQGSLEDFALGEVLGLLAAGEKSGRLRVTGDRGTGSLWLDRGALTNGIVGARTDASIEEIVFELMRFSSGEFAFAADERAVEAGEPQAVADVVVGAKRRLDEWHEIESFVPSLSHIVFPSPDLPLDEVTISNDEWHVLIAAIPSATVRTVCDVLEFGEVDGSRAVKSVIERGLLQLAEPAQQLPGHRHGESGLDASVPVGVDDEEPLGGSAMGAESGDGADIGHDEYPTQSPVTVGTGFIPEAEAAAGGSFDAEAFTSPPTPREPAGESARGEQFHPEPPLPPQFSIPQIPLPDAPPPPVDPFMGSGAGYERPAFEPIGEAYHEADDEVLDPIFDPVSAPYQPAEHSADEPAFDATFDDFGHPSSSEGDSHDWSESDGWVARASTGAGMPVPPPPPSPSEIAAFAANVQDSGDLAAYDDDDDEGSLLMRYLKSEH